MSQAPQASLAQAAAAAPQMPSPAPVPSPLDRTPAVAPPCTTPQVTKYLPPGDITAALQSSPDNVRWACAPGEKYSWSGGAITAKNLTLDLCGSTLTLAHHPGDGCDVLVKGAYFTLCNGVIVGDKTTAIHNTAPGCTFADLSVSGVNIFLINDPTAISVTCARLRQASIVGGQFIYNFADSFTWVDCELPFGSSAESPLRFSHPDPATFPGYGRPVGCVVRGGLIYQPASAANFQKAAMAVRGVNLKVRDLHVTGSIAAGQMSGADEDVLDVENCTFDPDPIYPSISTQSGVRLSVNRNRFRDSLQPIDVGNGSKLLAPPEGNTIVGPPGYHKALVFHQNGTTEQGNNTLHVTVTPPASAAVPASH